MTAPPLQPGSIAFLRDFVRQCTAGGTTSQLKGPLDGVITESDLSNVQRVPIMFRCVLPQNNGPRHALMWVRPEMSLFERDNAMQKAFSIENRINGTGGKIEAYRPVWAVGHVPPAAEVDTFDKIVRVMGERKNGLIEVQAVQLQCHFCDQVDRTKLAKYPITDVGLRPVCLRCAQEILELEVDWALLVRY